MSDEIRFSFEPPPELVALGRAAHRLIEQMLVIDEDSPGARADLVRARRSLEEATEALARHACTGEGLRVTTSTPAPGARRS